VLELDTAGKRFGEGARFSEAAELYRSIRADDKEADVSSELSADLIYAEKFAEARAEAQKAKPGTDRNAILMVAAAALEGPSAAVAESRKLPLTDRQKGLEMAGQTLVRLRRYSLAADLLDAAAAGSANAAQLAAQSAALRKFKKVDHIELPPGDPTSIVKQIALAITDEQSTPASIRGYFNTAAAEDDASLEAGLLYLRRALAQKGVARGVFTDAVHSALDMRTEGDARNGWRVRMQGSLAQRSETMFYLTSEGGRPRLVCATPCRPALAAEALSRAKGGDLDGARQWLLWAHEGMGELADVQAAARALMKLAWPAGGPTTADEIRLAAAALAGGASADAVPILRNARDSAQSAEDRSTWGAALATSLAWRKQYEEALTVARLAAREAPDSSSAAAAVWFSLEKLERWDEMAAFGRERLSARPDDPISFRVAIRAAAGSGDFDEMIRLARKQLERGVGEAWYAWNEIAWGAVCRGKADEGDIDAGRRAVDLSKAKPEVTNTLAALYAQAGRQDEARALLRKLIGDTPEAQLTDGDWYLVGRVAEGDGLPHSALLAYGHIDLKKGGAQTSMAALARKRMAALASK
jgi:tetratricopeptide (TPR) repeat protein